MSLPGPRRTADEQGRPERAAPAGAVRERVFHNAAAAVAARAATGVFQVLATLTLARCLGEQEWGLYGYLLASLDIFAVLTNLGLDVVGIRLMAVGAWRPRAVVKHLLLLKTALCIAGLAGLGVVSLVVPRLAEHRGLLALLGLALLPISLLSSVTVRFQTEHRMERLIPAQFAAGALYLLAVHAGSALGLRLPGFVALFAAFQLLTYLLTVVVSRRTWPPSGARDAGEALDRALFLTILRQSIPVGGAMIMVVTYSRLGVFLLERFQGLEAVGQYYIALKISEPLLAIAGALAMSAYPVFSRLAERGAATELRRRVLRYSLGSAAVSGAVAAVSRRRSSTETAAICTTAFTPSVHRVASPAPVAPSDRTSNRLPTRYVQRLSAANTEFR